MYWLDLVIFIVLGISIAYSLWRGLVREIISFASFVLAAILAARYCQWGSEHLVGILKNERLASIVGFSLIFMGVVAAGVLAGRLARSFMKKVKLGGMDRLLGGTLGLMKAVVLIAVLLLLIGHFVPGGDKILDKSAAAPVFWPASDVLADFLPSRLIDNLLEDIEHGVIKIRKYEGRIKKKSRALNKKYAPELEKLGEDFKEKTADTKKALEEDRRKVKKLLKDNL